MSLEEFQVEGERKKIKVPKFSVHPDFKRLTYVIQDRLVKEGVDSVQNKTQLWRITKIISNLFNANPQLIDAIVEAKRNAN